MRIMLYVYVAGTFISGLSVLCCSKMRGDDDFGNVIWLNSWVALLQLLLTPVLGIGWFWSVKWGMSFVAIAGV